MLFFIKPAIAAVAIFLSSWIPLVGGYHCETAVCASLLGLFCIPLLAPSADEKSRARKMRTVFACVAASIIYFVAANAIYIAMASVRGMLCSFSQGLRYQLLIALPSNLLAGCIIAWGQTLFKRKISRIIAYCACLALDLGFALHALYEGPAIVAYSQFIGYFAGSIYDESIDVFRQLTAYRLGTASIVILWAYAACGKLWRQILIPPCCVILAFAFHIYLSKAEQIMPLGREAAAAALWATIDTPQYRVHYAPKSKNRAEMAAQRSRLTRDFDRDYAFLKSFFRAEPLQKPDLWLYPDADAKARFLGARRTSFARLWKNELHLAEAAPDSTLARHEMAHLFAASFSTSTFGVAGGWIPSMGWTEGLAMAAEWPADDFDLHAWAQGILVNSETFGTVDPVSLMYGFWGLPVRVSYTLAGSFVRWLIDRYGIEEVKKMSNLMPGDYEDAFGISYRDLFEIWRNETVSRPMPEGLSVMTRAVFASQSIWTRRCARARAFNRQRYAECLSSPACPERTADALLKREFCSDQTGNPGDAAAAAEMAYQAYMAHGAVDSPERDASMLLRGNALSSFADDGWGSLERGQNDGNDGGICRNAGDLPPTAADYRSAIVSRMSKIDIEALAIGRQMIWRERAADMLWHAGQNTLASLCYGILLQTEGLPRTLARRAEIKKQASETMISPVSQILRLWFGNSLQESPAAVSERYPRAPILSYLAFVNAINRRDFVAARRAYVRVLTGMAAADRATRLPGSAWREFWRLAPYL